MKIGLSEVRKRRFKNTYTIKNHFLIILPHSVTIDKSHVFSWTKGKCHTGI